MVFQPINQYKIQIENVFAYHSITRINTLATILEPEGDTDTTIDPTNLVLSKPKNLLTSWNKIDPNVIQKNVTIRVWGDRAWAEANVREIVLFSAAHGKLVVIMERSSSHSGESWFGLFTTRSKMISSQRPSDDKRYKSLVSVV